MNWRAILTSPLGFLIGLSLGALGGGGSILAVPALVYGAGQTAKEATTTSLILVGVTSLVGIVPHWRAGRVRMVPGLLFGLAGVGGSLLGSSWNKAVDADVLLFAFSVLMLVAAGAMWRRSGRPAPAAPGTTEGGKPADTLTLTKVAIEPAVVVKVLVAGSVVGLLTGFFGVGGGFVIVPGLVLALGFTMPEAVGTSLLVIAINSAVALSTRLGGSSIDWSVIVPFMITSLLGMRVGARLAGTKDPAVLTRWFVFLLVAVALYTGGRSLVALV